MKATVWTSWNPHAADHDEGKPKCIFNGDIALLPRVDEYVVVREGFAAERVVSVTHDLVTGEIEIAVYTSDPNNEYPSISYD